ncbi:asparagine synthase (glutamine-hydrolysing) [Nitrosomonas sp. Nm51]|uniref:asparagine synthetase B family protein n=1 Tax=Nitrosomonas sp. Nm51 TaxID=133720 RepID=UPI0008BCAA5A|nr:asparagine synthase-related protein [Nitrosomonas sp. Nm51]SER75189.1 asparagine synthase (glutamine-hydrolysing) [Nitrosomonas sp. Nm51]
MGGICGWTGCNMAVAESRRLLEEMTKPIKQFDSRPVQLFFGKKSALAVNGHPDSVHIYQSQGLIIGILGHIRLRNHQPGQHPEARNIAQFFLESWLAIGEKAFADLTGEFTLCIIDENKNQCMLAVDRLGTRSLACQASGEQLIFSTSLDAIIRHPQAKPQIDAQSLFNYVYFHMIPSPGTIYKNQYRLLPGQYLAFRNNGITTDYYWKPSFDESNTRSFEDLKAELHTRLRSSIRDAVGNETAGAFLSGGTDSSTIAGVLGEVTGKPAVTYSIGFDAKGYDEMEYARIAARHFSTQHHEYYVTPDDVVTAVPEIAAVFDQPFGNASAIPAFFCARMAKADGITRILGGDGGDELFGGNERYAKQYLFSLYSHLPSFLREKILEPWTKSVSGKQLALPFRKVCRFVEQAAIPMPARMNTYNLLIRHGITSIFTADFLATVDTTLPDTLSDHAYHQTNAKSLINKMLAYDWKFTLADNDLPKVVNACELAQIDVAFPLISDELLFFSTQLKPDYKVKKTRLRYFFKEALKDFLPKAIIAKQKHGFGLPFGVWLQEHPQLKALAADSLTDLKSRNMIRSDFIDTLLEQHLQEHAGYHGAMIWILMMLEQWHKLRKLQL